MSMLLADASVGAAAVSCGTPEEASSLCMSVLRLTGNSVLAEAAESLIARPAKIAVILIVAFLGRRLLGRLLDRLVDVEAGTQAARRASRAKTIAALLRSVGTVAIWTVAALMTLSELGLNVGPLVAGAGIVGIAVGFGAQNLVRDFLSGIFMLMEDQYGVGDVVDVGEVTGTVEGISLRTTRLRDVNGTVWHVPNGHIQQVGNKSQQWSRAVLDVEVAYETDIAHATAVIKAAADSLCADGAYAEMILDEPEVWGVENLGADSVAIRLVLKTQPGEQLDVTRELRARIKRALDEAGIEIPFPQRTIWHRSGGDLPVLVPAGQGERR